LGILKFFEKHNALPKLNDEGDAKELFEFAKVANNESLKLDDLSEQVVKNVSYFARTSITSVSAVLGGLAA
jgi:hypothetical protein